MQLITCSTVNNSIYRIQNKMYAKNDEIKFSPDLIYMYSKYSFHELNENLSPITSLTLYSAKLLLIIKNFL